MSVFESTGIRVAQVNCPACGQRIELPVGQLGKPVLCPTCNQEFTPPREGKDGIPRMPVRERREVSNLSIALKCVGVVGLVVASFCALVHLLNIVGGDSQVESIPWLAPALVCSILIIMLGVLIEIREKLK